MGCRRHRRPVGAPRAWLLPPEVCPPGAARAQQREAVERVLLAWELNAHVMNEMCVHATMASNVN